MAEVSLQELGYRIKHWSVDEGLPSGFVFSVTQTPEGEIWASTIDGVARCDGRRFRSYSNPDDGTTVLFHRPELHVDAEGRLWSISRQGGMVVSFASGEPRLLAAEDGLPEGYLHPVTGRGRDSPYLQRVPAEGTPANLFGRTEGENFAPHSPTAFPDLSEICEDPHDGALFARTAKNELVRIRDGKMEPVELPLPEGVSPAPVVALISTRTEAPCAVTDLGLFRRTGGEWQLERRFSHSAGLPGIAAAALDWQGQLWLLRDGNLVVVGPDGTQRSVTPRPFEAPMAHLFIDREGSIWIPTRQGLYQLVGAEFTYWRVDPDGLSDTTYNVSEDGDGRIWISGKRNTYYLEPGKATAQTLPGAPLPSSRVVGRSTSGGAYVSHISNSLHFATPQAVELLGSETSSLMLMASDGAFWTGSAEGFQRRPSPGESPVEIGFPMDVTRGIIVQDSKGRLFVALRGVGIIKLDEVEEPRVITAPRDSLIAKRPNALIADPDDNIWYISRGPNGLGYWSPEEDRWYFAEWADLETPFQMPINMSLCADREGGFWIVSTSGILHADRGELMGAVAGGGRPVAWRELARSDGLPTIAGSFHNRGSYLDSKGRVWVPTDDGVAMTDPVRWKRVREQIPPPPVMLTSLRIDNHAVPDPRLDPLEVEPGGHLLEIDYKALHFRDPDRVRYRYRLLGFEDEWTPAGVKTSVRYQKLPHGSYRFEVIADNGFGRWSEVPASLEIVVHPQWWERAWVRVSALLLLVLFGFLAYRQRVLVLQRARTRQERFSRSLIETQESERQRLSRELHDGLGQNLLVIKNGLSLEAQRDQSPDSADEAFRRYADAAGECLSEVRQMSQDLRPHQIDRLGLKVAIESVADRLSETSRVPISREIDDLSGLIQPELEIHLLRIVQEVLGNAIRHSDASGIELSIGKTKDGVDLRVQDDGKGFRLEEARARRRSDGGLGLISIEERARMLGGICHFTTAPGEGTLVEIHIPTTRITS